METEYDLFERNPDGSVIWKGFAQGAAAAVAQLARLARSTRNQLFAMHLQTREMIVHQSDGVFRATENA
jgi:hypothetical protein